MFVLVESGDESSLVALVRGRARLSDGSDSERVMAVSQLAIQDNCIALHLAVTKVVCHLFQHLLHVLDLAKPVRYAGAGSSLRQILQDRVQVVARGLSPSYSPGGVTSARLRK